MSVSFFRGFPNRRETFLGLRSPWIWGFLILSLILDVWIWRQGQARVRIWNEASFDRRVDDIRGALVSRLESQELILRGCVGLHAAHDSLDREAWRSYIQALQLDRKLAGVQGVGFAARITPGQKKAWEKWMRGQGFHDFRIWPTEPGREMAPIVFLESSDGGSLRALGFDMYSDPVRRDAMEQACDSGSPVLSARVQLIRDNILDPRPQAGFLLLLPIYRTGMSAASVEERRRALEGFVYSPFRMGDLLAGILPSAESNGVGFAIFDGPSLGPENLLYNNRNYAATSGRGAGNLFRVVTLPLYGRDLTLRFAATPSFFGDSESGRPDLILALGAAISLLLAGGMLILVTTRLRAERLAESMTSELRALQANLEKLVVQRTHELERANRELGSEMERRMAREDQLRQSQKMEAVGRLAGGVAHDFNNLLTAINGYAALSLEIAPLDSGLRTNLEEIRRAGEMAASLTRQLLAYSRKQILSMRLVSLNEVVGDMGRMIRRLIGDEIEVSLDLSPQAGMVKVDPSQLQQSLINLALNARDAMPEGGRLSIETGAVELGEPESGGLVGEAARTGDSVIPPGRYAVLTVRDTGQGMEEAVKARLFEPYFTTKQQGTDKGTGLGLSMVYGIVRQSGGYIQVHSEPGKGTAFRIFLPEHRTAAATATAAVEGQA